MVRSGDAALTRQNEAGLLSNMPKVLLIADFQPGTLGLYYERAFVDLGWCVSRYDCSLAYRVPKPLPQVSALRRAMRPLLWHRMNGQVWELASDSWDLIVAVKAAFLDTATVEHLRHVCNELVNIYPDSPWDRWTQRRNVLEPLSHFRRTYIWSRTLETELHKVGVPGARYLPFAFDPTDHQSSGGTADASPRQGVLVFLGQPHPIRLAYLKALEGLPVRVFGAQWKQSWFGDQSSVRVTRATPMGAKGREIYEQSLVALNIMHEKNLTGHNMRTFEIPPTGALMIGTRTEDVEALFPDGIASLSSSSTEEFRQKCNWALAHPEAALRIGREGASRVHGHTYADRAQAMLQDLAL